MSKENTNLIKQSVKNYRRLFELPKTLKQGHLLELLIAMLTDSKSWNHYCAHPVNFSLVSSQDEYVNRIFVGMFRLSQLARYQNGLLEIAQATFRLLDVFYGHNGNGVSLVKMIPHEGFHIIGFHNKDQEEEVRAAQLPFILAMSMDIGKSYNNYLWDMNERLALSEGFSKEQAGLIRMTQREAYQHTWPIEYWFATGLLARDQERYLKYLKTMPHWEAEFNEYLESDGCAVPFEYIIKDD